MPDVDGRYLGEISTPRRWDGRRLINLDADEITLGALDPARFLEAVLSDGSREITGNQIFSGLPEFQHADGFKTDKIVERTSGTGVSIDAVPLKDGKVDGVDVSHNISAWAGTPSSQSLYHNIKALFITGTLSNGVLTINLSTPFTNCVVFVNQKLDAQAAEYYSWWRVNSTTIRVRSSNPNSSANVGVMIFGI